MQPFLHLREAGCLNTAFLFAFNFFRDYRRTLRLQQSKTQYSIPIEGKIYWNVPIISYYICHANPKQCIRCLFHVSFAEDQNILSKTLGNFLNISYCPRIKYLCCESRTNSVCVCGSDWSSFPALSQAFGLANFSQRAFVAKNSKFRDIQRSAHTRVASRRKQRKQNSKFSNFHKSRGGRWNCAYKALCAEHNNAKIRTHTVW